MSFNRKNDTATSLPLTLTAPIESVAMTPTLARRVATLERRAPRMIERAAAVQVPIEYLGVAPLFAETRLYEGPETDWTFGPFDEHEEAYFPVAEQHKLRELRAVSEFAKAPIYIGHEIPKEKTNAIAKAQNGRTTIQRSEATALIGPAPLPIVGIEASERYGRYAGQVIQGLKVAGTIGLGAAVVAGAAAVVVAAAPFALLGVLALDPVIVAAIPAGRATAGTPAAWYVVARWDW